MKKKEETFQDVFRELFSESFKLLVERQEKYGNLNIQQLGLYGVMSRIANDKLSRVMKSLNGRIVGGQAVLDPIDEYKDEAFEDALMDIANYALIAISLKRGVWGKPLDPSDKDLVP